jgi:hypothetical protein
MRRRRRAGVGNLNARMTVRAMKVERVTVNIKCKHYTHKLCSILLKSLLLTVVISF